MSLLDDLARPYRRDRRDDRPDPFGRLPELMPAPDARPAFDDPFALSEPVGAAGRNRRDDVARIETLLGAAGYLDLDATEGPTGYFGQRLDRAIREFQKNNGLKVDGAILPGGETVGALAELVAHQAPASYERPVWATPPILPERGDRDLDPKTMGRVLAMMRPAEPPRSDRVTPAAAPAIPFIAAGAAATAAAIEAMRRYNEFRRKAAPGEIDRNEGILPVDPIPPLPGFPAEPPKLPDHRDPPPEPVEPPVLAGTPLGDAIRNDPLVFQAFSDALIKKLAEPLYADRGGDSTELGHKAILEKKEALQKTLAPWGIDPEWFEHTHGAYENGTGKYLKEKYLPNIETKKMKGGSHADLTLKDRKTDKNIHINTGKVLKKDGKTPIAQERRQFQNMAKNAGEDVALFLPKLLKGMDIDTYKDDVVEKLREFFIRYLGPPRK